MVGAARCFPFETFQPFSLPPVAKASTDLTVRKAPVLFGWAEQGRAQHDLRPDGDPTQGAGAVKSGGTRASRGRNRIFPAEAGAVRDTRAPVRGTDRMAGGLQQGIPASLVRAERRPG